MVKRMGCMAAWWGVLLGVASAGCGSPSAASSSDDGGAGADGSVNGNDATTGPDGASPGADAHAAADGAVAPGMPPPMTSAVTILVEPNGNKGQELIDAINGATTSVHMTMYLLSNTGVINALLAQHAKGHDVKVMLNTKSPATNAQAMSQLVGAGVNVVAAPAAFALTHEKCVIIDGQAAWIMTMNATQTSPTDNREYLAIDTDAQDVAEAELIFEADFSNKASSPTGNLVVAPVNARGKLVELIASAMTTVDVEGEELSDTGIVAALNAAADHGLAVRVIVASTTPTATQMAAVASVKQHGIKVVQVSQPYIHAKAIVVDRAAAYVGSENFSTGSLLYNRELGVLTNALAEVTKVQTTIDADFGNGQAL